MHLLYFTAPQSTTHTLFQLKGWHSPTALSHFPSLALCQHPAFFSPHAQFDPLLLARQGGTLGCDLEDESVLIAPFIDSCLSNSSKREALQRVPLS